MSAERTLMLNFEVKCKGRKKKGRRQGALFFSFLSLSLSPISLEPRGRIGEPNRIPDPCWSPPTRSSIAGPRGWRATPPLENKVAGSPSAPLVQPISIHFPPVETEIISEKKAQQGRRICSLLKYAIF